MVKLIESKAEFEAALKAEGGKLIVVDFYATWCGPCKVIAPKIQELEKNYPNVTFLKIDVDENAETSESLGITAMPTFYFYKNGIKIDEVIGANEKKIAEMIKTHSS